MSKEPPLTTYRGTRYLKSLAQLEAAEKVIPLGAQTFSKSRRTLPPGIAPLFADRAQGCRIWDVDGNEYVDLVSGLAAVNLGYADPEINEAVARQLSSGVTISLSHPIETEVAERLTEIVPSAEMVRFGKNGSDATTAAIRIARGYTGRDHVVVCGYHGWQDWYIGSVPTRSLGVPEAYTALIHSVPYNDLDAMEFELKRFPTAAIILEPMTSVWPAEGYLEGVRKLATRYGAVLVFDEMVTGFRFASGGAQEYFGVTPDLSAFGKGIANGFPLSAIVGRRELMRVLETAFISGTFGGELLSLTAASVVLRRVAETDVIAGLAITGTRLRERVQAVIDNAGLTNTLTLAGHPAWTFLVWDAATPALADLKALFMQEMSRNGVLMMATHNVMAATDDAAIETVAAAYTSALKKVSEAIAGNNAMDFLDVDYVETGASIRQ